MILRFIQLDLPQLVKMTLCLTFDAKFKQNILLVSPQCYKTLQPSSPTLTSSSREFNTGKWNEHQCSLFQKLLQKYGKNYGKIAAQIGSRKKSQVISHAQKYFNKLQKISEKKKQINAAKQKLMKGQPAIVTRRAGQKVQDEFISKNDIGSLYHETQFDTQQQELSGQGPNIFAEPSKNKATKAVKVIHPLPAFELQNQYINSQQKNEQKRWIICQQNSSFFFMNFIQPLIALNQPITKIFDYNLIAEDIKNNNAIGSNSQQSLHSNKHRVGFQKYQP